MRFGSRSVCAFLLMPSLEHTNLCEVAFPSNLHLFLTIFYPKHPSLIRIYEPHTNLRCPLANFCHCTTLSKMHNTRIDRIIQRGSCRIVRCSGGGSPPSSTATSEPLVALLHGSVAPLPRRRRAASLPGALAQLSSLSLESPLCYGDERK